MGNRSSESLKDKPDELELDYLGRHSKLDLDVLHTRLGKVSISAPAKCRKVVSIKSYPATRGRPRTHHTAG